MQSVAKLDAELAGEADLTSRLRLIGNSVPEPIVFTTSFGLEDQILLDALIKSGTEAKVVTLDTGRLFPEIVELWAETERRHGIRIEAYAPEPLAAERLISEHGPLGFRQSLEARLACCAVRKVDPLARALAGAGGWLTGLRVSQSRSRAGLPFAAWDPDRQLLKISPLADWSRDDTVAYAEEHRVPVNVLHARGFLSIGCAPCTRAVMPGEDERAGRWWWEQPDAAAKECGLHVGADGRLTRLNAA